MTSRLLPAFLALPIGSSAQGVFCDPQGNVAIFSNYDGGALTINVDQDIPDLHIGIVSYEFAVINITGPFVGNVTEVRWAGFNGDNDHCGTGATTQSTVIGGVTSGASEIETYPPATLTNPNGNPNIICAYSCDVTTEQGGCNTVDQVVDYFMDQWGGALYFHRTQYGCWNTAWNISDGGNCCLGWSSTLVTDRTSAQEVMAWPSPVDDVLFIGIPGRFEIVDAGGRVVRSFPAMTRMIPVSDLAPGSYRLRSPVTGRCAHFIVAR
jgi:hypothetical protein